MFQSSVERMQSDASLDLVQFFQDAVLSWYTVHKRDLPWRRTDDPYKIMVSEIMLQQTQVDRVIPKYVEFLSLFPTAEALATAKLRDVLSVWSGLGYNRRALYLQQAAREVVARGTFPSEEKELRTLHGIGAYTAHAIQAFAFHEDVAVIDTNIRRIASRLFFAGVGTIDGIDTIVAQSVPAQRGTDWNNALMDFGSLVCTTASPQCAVCPLRPGCTAYAQGTQDRFLRIAPPQKRFEGSRRQIRGLILKQLNNKAQSIKDLSNSLKKPEHLVADVVQELTKEKLVVHKRGKVTLP